MSLLNNPHQDFWKFSILNSIQSFMNRALIEEKHSFQQGLSAVTCN
ncbi:hypothetical protein FWK35_00007649 [Aphis craccivora]|uniref:Uncharacterized protein n=1 Tax=Aphis craccivora TaxID=307492 RepID=A0A6G0ZHH7_APHCR|nr:hypothetical protein FWK35_00007649 [Aphis craccivora]